MFTTASIGIALSATGYDRPEDILRDAETAMYRAKNRGKACYEVFDTAMYDSALSRSCRWKLISVGRGTPGISRVSISLLST